MKKLLSLLMGLFLVGGLVSSCDDDSYTEEDALNDLQKINVVISVTDASSNYELVEGATVKMVDGESILEATTDAAGIALFSDVKVGSEMPVYVSKEGFTTTFKAITLSTNSAREVQVGETVAVYSLADDKMAVVKGRMSVQSDLTTEEREAVPEGTEILLTTNDLPEGNSNIFVGKTDANGNYEVKVPVSSGNTFRYQVDCPTLELNQKVALVEDGEASVVERKALYMIDSSEPTYIAEVPSAIVSIAEPVAKGKGFELEAKPVKRTLDLNDRVKIIDRGSNYFKEGIAKDEYFNVIVPFSKDADGNQASLRLTFKDGGLMYAWASNNYKGGADAMYDSKPTIDLTKINEAPNGKGIKIDFDFSLRYDVLIKNHGTEYLTNPQIEMNYRGVGEKAMKKVSYGTSEFRQLFGYNDLLARCTIVEGSIYKNVNGGESDVLARTEYFAEAPMFTCKTIVDQAEVKLHINEGEVAGYFNLIRGNGYDPLNPPVVTVTTLAGKGSGAVLEAKVNAAGQVENIEIVERGEGYTTNVNVRHQYSNGGLSRFELHQGQVVVNDIFYGTGRVMDK
ncbi:MAG: hypothetical protein ACEPOZ_04580 [Marinifilaceae bacterium]